MICFTYIMLSFMSLSQQANQNLPSLTLLLSFQNFYQIISLHATKTL